MPILIRKNIVIIISEKSFTKRPDIINKHSFQNGFQEKARKRGNRRNRGTRPNDP